MPRIVNNFGIPEYRIWMEMNHIVKGLIGGSRDGTNEQWIVRPQILAFQRKSERQIASVFVRSNIGLSDLLRYRIAVITRV